MAARRNHSQPRPPLPRSGVISLWTAGALSAFGLLSLCVIGIWLDSSRLLHARHAAESAAIAAAHSWISDELLKVSHADFEKEARLLRAREAAEYAVKLYDTTASKLALSDKDPECFWHQASDPIPRPLLVPAAIRITIPNAIPPYSLGLARLIPTQPLFAASSAILECQPAALAPAPGSAISFLPFALLDSPAAPGLWTRDVELYGGPDELAWIPERRQFEPGSDGIPEIKLVLSTDPAAPTENKLLPFQMIPADPTLTQVTGPRFHETIRSGLSHQSLQRIGLNELLYPSGVSPSSLEPDELSRCLSALAETAAEPRILSLAEAAAPTSASSTTPAALTLVRPVAVRIAQIDSSSTIALSTVTLTLQPCVLVSSMIRTHPSAPFNRQIFSIRLLE